MKGISLRRAAAACSLFFLPIFLRAGLHFPSANPAQAFTVGNCIKGNCFNGEGTMVFANGDKYMGQFREGEAQGDGIMYFANGNKYYGSWEHNLRHGRGRMLFYPGHEYLGGFQTNYLQGTGVMHFANGDTYDGEWQLSQPHGQGSYSFHTGDRYAGMFSEGRFHGKGTMNYRNGATFTGSWMNGKKHGTGVYRDPTGRPVTVEWVFGKPLGQSPLIPDVETVVATEKDLNQPAPLSPFGEVTIYAVIVGIANYPYMPTLRYTDDDAFRFYAFLKSPEGGALADRQIQLLTDDQATRNDIVDAVYTTFAKADENDVVLFFFSGHGLDGALVPYDFDGINNRLYHDELRQAFQTSKARHKILLGDACYSGSLLALNGLENTMAARSGMGSMLRKFYAAFDKCNGGTAVFASSRDREISLEDNGLRAGVFSHFLLKALKGAADKNGDGLVVLSEVYEYVTTKVTKHTAGAQTPMLMGEFDDQTPMAVVRDK